MDLPSLRYLDVHCRHACPKPARSSAVNFLLPYCYKAGGWQGSALRRLIQGSKLVHWASSGEPLAALCKLYSALQRLHGTVAHESQPCFYITLQTRCIYAFTIGSIHARMHLACCARAVHQRQSACSRSHCLCMYAYSKMPTPSLPRVLPNWWRKANEW